MVLSVQARVPTNKTTETCRSMTETDELQTQTDHIGTETCHFGTKANTPNNASTRKKMASSQEFILFSRIGVNLEEGWHL